MKGPHTTSREKTSGLGSKTKGGGIEPKNRPHEKRVEKLEKRRTRTFSERGYDLNSGVDRHNKYSGRRKM